MSKPEIIPLAEYTCDQVSVNDSLMCTSDLRYEIENGEITEHDSIFPVEESCIRDMVQSGEAFVNAFEEHVYEEIEDGMDYVNWIHGRDAAIQELNQLLNEWTAKHLKENSIYFTTLGQIDITAEVEAAGKARDE